MAVTEVHREWSAERMEAEILYDYGMYDLPGIRSNVTELERVAYENRNELATLNPACAIAINPEYFRRDMATIVDKPCELTSEQILELRNFSDFYGELDETATAVSALLRSDAYISKLDDRIADGRSASYWDIFDTEGIGSRDLELVFTNEESIIYIPLSSYEKSAVVYVLELVLLASALGVAIDARKQLVVASGRVRYEILVRKMRHQGQLTDARYERSMNALERIYNRGDDEADDTDGW